MPELSTVSRVVVHPTGFITVVAVGDSIASNSQFGSWFESTVLESCGRIRKIRNAGVGGDKVRDVINRFATDVVPYKSDEIWLQIGTNDIPTFNAVTYRTDLLELLTMATATGRKVRVITIPPRTSYALQVFQANQIQKNLCDELNIQHHDIWRGSFDPITGDWLSGHSCTDGVHPITVSSTLAKNALIASVGVSKTHNIVLPTKNTDVGVFNNSLFLIDTNSDGKADGVSQYGASGTLSLVAGSYGNEQKFAVSGASAVDGLIIASTLPAARKYSVSGKLRLTSITGGYWLIKLSHRVGSTETFVQTIFSGTPTLDGEFYETVEVSANVTGLWLGVYVIPSGSVTAEFYLSQYSITEYL